MIRQYFIVVFIFLISSFAISQNDYSDRLQGWKTQFPKEDVVAATLKETVSFALNLNAGPGEAKVNATIKTEMILVPVRDYIKYEDGLFYTEENTVEDIKVINSLGKNVVFDKQCMPYSESDIFHNDTRLCVVKFGFNEKGKGFQYSFVSNYRDVKYVTSFYFNDHIPAAEKIVEFQIPSWLDIDLREFNFQGAGIQKSTAQENGFTKVTFSLKNAGAYKRESHSPHPALSQPHLICVTRSYTENGTKTSLFSSVKDLYGWYSSLCDSIGNKPAELKTKVDELTFGKKNDLEKIESVFYWVQDKIRYIAFEHGIMGFKPDAAQNVYKKKYGDCKGKANLLKEMLKLAGYDARLTWIGTSDLPYDYTLPSLAVDNHMICTVIINGKKYFLDGTEENIALNDYAQRIQGKQVLIEDGKNYILDKIPEFPADRNKVKNITKLILEGDKMKGATTVEFNGEAKVTLQRAYNSIRNDNKADALSNFLRNGNENVEVGTVKNPDFNERQKPMQVGFDFTVSNQVTK
jgi:hypothetical protein